GHQRGEKPRLCHSPAVTVPREPNRHWERPARPLTGALDGLGRPVAVGCRLLRGGGSVWWSALAMPCSCHGVDHEGVTDQTEQLTLGSDAGGATEVQVVIDLTVGRFCVAAASLQTLVVRVTGRNLPDVLGTVEVIQGSIGPARPGDLRAKNRESAWLRPDGSET